MSWAMLQNATESVPCRTQTVEFNKGGILVTRSFRVVLKVRNAESTLADRMHEMFEILSDFSERFEVVVQDEGSDDQTEEVACDLAVRYPQMRYMRLGQEHSRTAEAAQQPSGDIVLVQHGHAPICPSHLRRLWQRRAADGTPQRIRAIPR